MVKQIQAYFHQTPNGNTQRAGREYNIPATALVNSSNLKILPRKEPVSVLSGIPYPTRTICQQPSNNRNNQPLGGGMNQLSRIPWMDNEAASTFHIAYQASNIGKAIHLCQCPLYLADPDIRHNLEPIKIIAILIQRSKLNGQYLAAKSPIEFIITIGYPQSIHTYIYERLELNPLQYRKV